MNPRYRRMLIPGLLVLLLVVVVVASLVQDAQASQGSEAPHEVVSTIADERITESSGLALSRRYPDLAYTVNDSAHEAQVFAVRVSTGEVVGVTTLRGDGLRDVEALALDDDGRLWVADTGDNRNARRDTALYVLDEPGRGDHDVTPTRYPLSYEEDESPDVEAVVVRDGTVLLVSKGLLQGDVYEVAVDDLDESGRVEASLVGEEAPLMVTDAALTPDGTHVLLRTYISVVVARAGDPALAPVVTIPVTGLQQGETIAVEESGRSFLVGSEGERQPLWRFGLDLTSGRAPVPAGPTEQPAAAGTDFVGSFDDDQVQLLLLGAALLTALAVVVGLVAVGLRRHRA